MPCILRITGENFDVDNFIKKSNVATYKVYYKGDAMYATKPEGKKNERSGCSIEIGKVDFENLDQQRDDVIVYLNQNKEKLEWINKTPEIQYAVLDFGLNYDSDKFVQSHYLPNKFLRLVSELDIGIEISMYQSADKTPENLENNV